MANLLALDQASITTGYAIFKDGKYSSHGKFSFDDHDIGMRLVKIRNKVLELIRENDITEIAFEDIQYQERVMNNVQTFKTLAEVYGVIQETLTELGLKYLSINKNSCLAGKYQSEKPPAFVVFNVSIVLNKGIFCILFDLI